MKNHGICALDLFKYQAKFFVKWISLYIYILSRISSFVYIFIFTDMLMHNI